MARSNKNRSARTRASSGSGRVRKKKKQDNTKLYIGLGVGGFFLFLFLVAVANSSSGSSSSSSNVSAQGSAFTLPLSVRQTIYREYDRKYDAIEDAAAEKTEQLSLEERRSQGRNIRASVSVKIRNMKVELRAKYKKQYPELTSSYLNKIIDEGLNKGW